MYELLTTEVARLIRDTYGVGDVDIDWQLPDDQAHGDVTTNIALKIAKHLGKKPREIADTIVAGLEGVSGLQKAEVAGAGYVNVWMAPDVLVDGLTKTLDACRAQPVRKEQPVIIEYSQPNIAKPLGVHHILSTVIGQAVSNIYEHMGYPVYRWNYLGDWGTQFGKLAVAYEKWGMGKKPSTFTLDELLALYVKFHEELEKDASLEDAGREAFRKLEQGDATLRAFREDVLSVTKASLGDMYRRLHVAFDSDLGESFYEDKMDAVIEEGKKKKVFIEGEHGSLIVQFPEETGMPPYLIRKGDGATLYSTRDLAQMRYRMDTFNPQAILIFTDIAQKLHFEQLVATCRMLGWDLPYFENVLFGRMRFADKSMSTRKGNILKLEDVLDEAVSRADTTIEEHGGIQTDDRAALAEMMGIGALVYGILSQNRKMDIVFDWDKMLSFEGNSAPYLQYTHARAKSVLRKAEEEGMKEGTKAGTLDAHERTLMKSLLKFTRALDDARREHLPHKLANFLFALCQDFNAFYNSCPILKAAPAERSLRLWLTRLTTEVLGTGSRLLTLTLPDRM